MPLYRASRAEVLSSLADEFLHNYGRGRAFLAVDGGPLADAPAFAHDLADVLRADGRGAYVASAADHHVDGSADGPDADGLRDALVRPFRRPGTPFALRPGADPVTDAPDDAVLIVAGDGLQTEALRGLWNAVVYLLLPDEPLATSGGDAASAPQEAHARYIRAVNPRRAATMIVDVSDPDLPRRVFADSC
ncbi:uridine kinase [Clavibacter michiganensis]|uniref:Uridine kinase n=1 Tax=Clavibacter michiganensis TaxID=28447 RepID=A0A251XVT7_9MICO|nr:uridine kinase [Clavibacter michiganensis]